MRSVRSRRSVWIVLVVFTFLLSGCEWVQDPKSLLSVPRLPDEQASLMSIITSHLPEGGAIIRPTNSSDNSAIRIADLNNDGQAEAIVFYETPDREVRIHGMILQSDGKTWSKTVDFDGEGVKLDRVDIVDLTNDNTLDLVIGYSYPESDSNKGMIIYSFNNNQLTKIFEQPYAQYVIDDLDRNMKNELYVVTNHKSKPPVLSQYKYDEDKLKKMTEKVMDNEINGFLNVMSGYISKDKRGIVMDANAGANYSFTIAVTLSESGELKEVFPKDLTIKKRTILSSDINADGIIEIPIPERPEGWEDYYEEYEIPFFQSYYQWDGKNDLRLVQKQFRDYMERFHFTIPVSWYGRVSIDTKSNINEYLRFIDFNTNETLAEVRFFSVETWERYKDKWTYLAAYGDEVIGIYSKEQLRLNDGTPKLPTVEQTKPEEAVKP
nr:hypothetical protein [Paenibacillus sp. ACRRX]